MRFNPPPGWPVPQANWRPPSDWVPDPSWPPAPPGWRFWIEDAVAPARRSSARARLGGTAVVAVLLVGAAGGLFGWLRYENEQQMVSSLTTIDIQGTEYTGIDDVTTAPDGTLYVLTGTGDHLDPEDTAVLKVDPATGASQRLPIPQRAFPAFRNLSSGTLAVGPDGSVFTGSHLWNPNTGAIHQVTSERVGHAAIDSRGRVVYAVVVEDTNDNYRATTTVYRASPQGGSSLLAEISGYAWGLSVDSAAHALLHIDATRWGDEKTKVVRVADNGDLEAVPLDDIETSSSIAVDDAGRLVYVCADRHAMCSRGLGATNSTRLEFTNVRPMWTSNEAVQLSGMDGATWLPQGKALAVTHVRGNRVVAVAEE